MLRLAIIATVANAADSIEAFIRYHQAIGFSRFYIFVDDSDVKTLQHVSGYPDVVLFSRDTSLVEKWKKTDGYADQSKRDLIEKEVMVRQELNFQVGYRLAKEDEVDWVLHLDLDELFYPNGCDLQEYFKELQLNNYRSITCLNYESISTGDTAENIYLSSEYFKVNYFKNKHWFYTEKQRDLLNKSDWLGDKYFRYYQNGKSCVSTYGSALLFYDVHSIIGDGRRKMGDRKDPLVLHFPCSTLTEFIRKYKTLGWFDENWKGIRRTGEFIDDVHLLARDFFCESERSDDEVVRFYRKYFVLTLDKIEILIRENLATRIDFHTSILGR